MLNDTTSFKKIYIATDIIYFQSNKNYTSKIVDDIENGELIYAKG